MDIISLSTPAKINRTLRITGFHETENLHTLHSEFCCISLADEIQIRKTKTKKIKITVSGKYSKGVPNNEHNTMYKAAKAFFDIHGFSFGIDIHVVKNIPHQAGLGGGSSNAAGVLKALEYFSGGMKNNIDLKNIGNDIPFFLGVSPTALVEGFGEILLPSELSPALPYGVCIFNPRITIHTSWAYQQYKTHVSDAYVNGINDFESIVFSHFPDLKDWKNTLIEMGAQEAGLTGSGSGIFGFFDSDVKRNNVLKKFPDALFFEPLSTEPIVLKI